VRPLREWLEEVGGGRGEQRLEVLKADLWRSQGKLDIGGGFGEDLGFDLLRV